MIEKMVGRVGFEPMTNGLKDSCLMDLSLRGGGDAIGIKLMLLGQ